jgi:hypothetical protein
LAIKSVRRPPPAPSGVDTLAASLAKAACFVGAFSG